MAEEDTSRTTEEEINDALIRQLLVGLRSMADSCEQVNVTMKAISEACEQMYIVVRNIREYREYGGNRMVRVKRPHDL